MQNAYHPSHSKCSLCWGGTPTQVWGGPCPRFRRVPHPRSGGVPCPRSRGVPHPRSRGYPISGPGGTPSRPGQGCTPGLGGTPSRPGLGVPQVPPIKTWDGVHSPARPGMGYTPSRPQMGYPLARPGMGYPPRPEMGYRHLPASVDRHTDSCQNIAFPRTTYAAVITLGMRFKPHLH